MINFKLRMFVPDKTVTKNTIHSFSTILNSFTSTI